MPWNRWPSWLTVNKTVAEPSGETQRMENGPETLPRTVFSPKWQANDSSLVIKSKLVTVTEVPPYWGPLLGEIETLLLDLNVKEDLPDS